MEALRSQDFKNILDIITMIGSCLDKDIFRQKLFDSLLKIFHMESSIFFLADENSKLTDFMGENVDNKYVREYVNYYHKNDPFRLFQGGFPGYRVVRLQQLVSYSSFLDTEYYNDFLRPQEIYYKTVIYLRSGAELIGIIGLFRPKGFGDFSEIDIRMMKILTPYLCHALKNIEIFRRIQLENSIFKMIDQDSSSGLIILNDCIGLVHMNQRAKEFLKILAGSYNGHRESSNGEGSYPYIPYILKEDCCHLREQMKNNSFDIIPLPIRRILKLDEHRKYSIRSKTLPKEMSPENRVFYIVKIDELTHEENLNIGSLENDFGLTKRESEILVNAFNALKNSEIAEKFFISEITVKKHLEHIFEKIGVNSRTALIRKILEYKSTNP